MRKYVVEILGTFAVVFAGTGAVVIDAVTGGTVTHVGISLTFGLIVMAMIYAVGEVSGAHLNPAVTLGFFVAGRFSGRCVLPYIASQLAGTCWRASHCARYSEIRRRLGQRCHWVPRGNRSALRCFSRGS